MRGGSARGAWLGEGRSRTEIPIIRKLRRDCGRFRERIIGGIDSRNSGGGERHAFRRQAPGDNQVRMGFAHQPMISDADIAERRLRIDAEYGVGICAGRFFRLDVMRANTGVGGGIKAEQASDLAQIRVFGIAQLSISERDVEQPVQHMLQHDRIAREQPSDLTGVAVKSVGALAGEIEHQPDMVFFTGRYFKHLVKRRHLVAGNITIRPRHFSTERDRRDRERNRLPRVDLRRTRSRTVVELNVMGDTIEQCAERPAKRELDRAADHSPDKAHRSETLPSSKEVIDVTFGWQVCIRPAALFYSRTAIVNRAVNLPRRLAARGVGGAVRRNRDRRRVGRICDRLWLSPRGTGNRVAR